MTEERDPLMKKMMMNSAQFIENPAFENQIMTKIRKREKRIALLRNTAFYGLPVLLTCCFLFLFSSSLSEGITSVSMELSTEKILRFLSGLAGQLHLLIVLFVLVVFHKVIRFLSEKDSSHLEG